MKNLFYILFLMTSLSVYSSTYQNYSKFEINLNPIILVVTNENSDDSKKGDFYRETLFDKKNSNIRISGILSGNFVDKISDFECVSKKNDHRRCRDLKKIINLINKKEIKMSLAILDVIIGIKK